jgi:pimeloyl-ACP methyl ester carboxylesterase
VAVLEMIFIIFWYLVILVFIASTIWVLATYLLFAYDRRLSQSGLLSPGYEERGGLPHGSSAFTAIVYEIFCTTISFLLLPFKKFKAKRPTEGHIRYHRPILLIHGLMHNQSGWIWLRRQIKLEKLGPVYTINLEPRHGSIEDFADQVAARAREIERETGQSGLILIGHSMGGLVASYYAEHLAPAGKVTDIITLGTPFDGTRPAFVSGRAICAMEMRPGSPLLQELRRKREQARDRRYYHIASLFDALVLPSQSAWSGVNEERLLVLPSHGHMRLLFSKRVAAQIVTWLKAVVPAQERVAEKPQEIIQRAATT